MKKGFTLVELAIVLVVIGILLGMAIKGKALMDAAQIRSDVNKLQKITSGYAIYYSKYDKMPGDGKAWSMMDNLTKDGTLSDSDFVSKLGGGYWAFVGCEAGNDATSEQWKAVDLSGTDKPSNICVTLVKNKPASGDTGGQSEAGNITPLFACYIETMLDNKNVNTGAGRGTAANQPAITVEANGTWDCSKQSDGSTVAKGYMYRIF